VFLFFVQAQYLLVLCSFKEQLQQHVRVHAVEAVVGCREIENTLQALTGMSFLFYLNAISYYSYYFSSICVSYMTIFSRFYRFIENHFFLFVPFG
jgi:hypothetical protein